MNKTDITKVVGSEIMLSEAMSAAMTQWVAMYENTASWITTDIKSMGLPAAISGEISRMVTAEMQVKLTGGARAEYLSKQLEYIISKLKNEKVEYALARGGMVVKPYVSGDKIAVDFVGADCLYPISFDATGNITSVVFSDTRKVGDWYYTRLEYHQMLPNNFYWVQNYVFKSHDKGTLGARASFTDVPEWSEIKPNTGENGEVIQYIANVTQPLYGYFRFPSPNNVDASSPMGVACFSHAQTVNDGVQLIKQADEIWSNLIWEFNSGKRAIYVDTTAFDRDANGKPILPDRRLYRTLDRTSNIGDKGNLFDEWSPEFREAAINSGLNAVLRRIEFNCRLAYGTLSDPQTVDKTATEILASQQRSYVTVTSTQVSLQSALDGLIYAAGIWADLYNLAPRGTVSAVYEWDDSVITNKADEAAQLRQEVGQGITSKVEYRMVVKREDEATAKKMLAMVDAERVPEEKEMFSGA
jgi:A118 family predicted phage portal protein